MLTDGCKSLSMVIPLWVALLGAFTATLLHSRADVRQGAARSRWRWAAAGLLGLSIWTCHASGLTLAAPAAMHDLARYLLLNGLSLVLCLTVSLLAWYPRHRALTAWSTIYGRPLGLGLGVSASHWLSLKAAGFNFDHSLQDTLVPLTFSLLASYAICHVTLTSRRVWTQSPSLRSGVVIVLTLAIAALHYASLIPALGATPLPALTLRQALDGQWLVALASLSALALLSGALFSALFDARRNQLTSSLVDSLTAANRELNQLAYHDLLTRLPNRSLFEEKLRIAIERARRDAGSLIILFIDLDGLKAINKAFGHWQGDRLLAYVASQIQSVLPRRYPLARTGGDEFVALLDLDSPQDVIDLGSQILNAISTPLQIENHPLSITASLGIAQYPQDGTTPRALIEHATMAMYHAKNGEQAYAFFEPTMHALARDHLLLLSDLRQALPREQLVLHYQPIMQAPDGPMVAAEVLIRWQHPQHGLLLPEAFIGPAERAGLIVAIGNWVIDAACLQLRRWIDLGALKMRLAINVSAIQLHYDQLVETLHSAVQRHRIEPSRLTLEFTESAAMKDPARSLDILQRLHRMGFRISLDDFGTGYSSLLYLRQLPATELKIDRSFVSEIDTLGHDRTIVSAIIALARQLHMSIVAEGVETPAQKRLLCELGCTYLQGYLLGAPVPASQLPVVIEGARVD